MKCVNIFCERPASPGLGGFCQKCDSEIGDVPRIVMKPVNGGGEGK